MKKYKFLLSLSIVVLLATRTIGQGVAVINAITYYEQNEYVKAKEYIDKAIVHEKTGKNAKTWYYRGLIYMALASQDKPEGDGGYKIAAEAFQKVQELDKPNGEWITEANKQKHNLWVGLLNTGVKKANDSKDAEAYEYYDMAHKMKTPEDTAYDYAYEYAAGLADRTDNAAQKKKYYLMLSEKTNQPLMFAKISRIYAKEGDEQSALEIIQKGRAKFPKNTDLMNEEINLYIQMKKVDEAQKKMEESLALDPKNVTLLYNLARIYVTQGNDVKAIEYYNRAVELEPENYDANFNMAAYYFNKGVKLNDVINQMTMKEYTANGKKKETERDALLKKGLIYFEKCKAINPSDENLKGPIADSYRILKIKK